MRPFRFFFAASLGIILFFFLAKFVVAALLLAAAMSLLFFFARKIKYFFQRMRWEEDSYYDGRDRFVNRSPKWKGDLLMDYPTKHRRMWSDTRIIKIQ
ncbi:MAG: hypothetical protein AAFZ15_00870 [Bacteroidota bacterium]